ncbi:circularly permuted type 2 ATP-grasp protein, partial [Rubellimicrobium rubrum]
MAICWDDYAVHGLHDELIQAPGRPRPGAEALCAYLASLDEEALGVRIASAESLIRLMGISFRVYGEDGGSIDRHWPYDL